MASILELSQETFNAAITAHSAQSLMEGGARSEVRPLRESLGLDMIVDRGGIPKELSDDALAWNLKLVQLCEQSGKIFEYWASAQMLHISDQLEHIGKEEFPDKLQLVIEAMFRSAFLIGWDAHESKRKRPAKPASRSPIHP